MERGWRLEGIVWLSVGAMGRGLLEGLGGYEDL